MHTKDMLAEELRKAGLLDMSVKAARGHYHDFLSPLPDPAMALDRDLVAVVTNPQLKLSLREAAQVLRRRHHNGEFDANTEESEAWAAGPEGQDAMRRLAEGK